MAVKGMKIMPSKVDKVIIGDKELDRRVKLTEEERKRIPIEYAKGDTSYSKLAKKYGVSKKLIMMVVDPEKEKRNKEQFKIRQSDGRYYNKDKHREYMKNHRNYKKELSEKNLIK